MKICFIGTGYVGLVSGVCFSDLGNNVICVDKDREKLSRLENGDIPIFEPGLSELVRKNLLSMLKKLKMDEKIVTGYGAPAKAATLLNYCNIGTDLIEYTVDLNPYKQGKYLPGCHIPIYSPDKIKYDKPEYILIFPWNIKEEVMNQLDYTIQWNCKFIIPIPEPTII